jgi:hypothetical protein
MGDVLLELAARCEAATGADRDLDLAIYAALGAVAPVGDDQYWLSPDKATRHYESLIPHYTSSIDAALTLFKVLPGKVPTNPRAVCAEALRALANG